MSQYIAALRRIVTEGVWVENKRTGKRCKTVIGETFTYNVGANEFPIDTTRKSYYKQSIAELLGYLRGYDNAAQFRAIGCNTWNANANENEAWLANPVRKGTDDMGRVYGAIARAWPRPDGGSVDLLRKIVDDLSRGEDDRGEILTFYNPGEFHLGCLRPCMHTHQFSLIGDQLYLNSMQRSCDAVLGGCFNQIQVATLLALIAQITGNKPAIATHHIVNLHCYEDQYETMRDVHVKREPFPAPKLIINPDIKTLEDIETWVTTDDFKVEGYQHHDPIDYPFTV